MAKPHVINFVVLDEIIVVVPQIQQLCTNLIFWREVDRSVLEELKENVSGRRSKYGFRVVKEFRFRGLSRDLLGSNWRWANNLNLNFREKKIILPWIFLDV